MSISNLSDSRPTKRAARTNIVEEKGSGHPVMVVADETVQNRND